MPGWQLYWQTRAARSDLRLVSIAVDAGGPTAPQPFVRAAGASFPTLVDPTNAVAGPLGARVVPNVLLVDGDGTVLWSQIGGISIDNPEQRAWIEAWSDRGILPAEQPQGDGADPLVQRLIGKSLRLAELHVAQGDVAAALRELEEARALDPENFIVRKQIWLLRYPERFHPEIDFAWQKTQLAQERAVEAACGPDGCRIPDSAPAVGGRGPE